MPAPGETETPQHVIDKNVEAYFAGKKRAAAIAKELKVSRAAVYLWIGKAKEAKLQSIKHADMTPDAVEHADKRDLALENEALKAEVRKLRDKVLDLMMKYGEI